MKRRLFTFFGLIFLTAGLLGQNKPQIAGTPALSLSHEPAEVAKLSYKLAAPKAPAFRWEMRLSNIERKHGSAFEGIDSIKEAKARIRETQNFVAKQPARPDFPLKATSEISIGTNFLGNELRNVSPPDNSVAVSPGGFVVSVDNHTIEYYRTNGQELVGDLTLRDFVDNPALNAQLFDPKVIYDPYEDRFILVILHGSTSSTSKLLVYFSESNDPRDGWFVYELAGAPSGQSVWFDYPSIGINNNELYIGGNLFTNANTFSQCILFQIEKTNGFSGGSIDFQRWLDVRDAANQKAFTIIPASEGLGRGYGPGIFLVSGRSGGNDNIYLYDLTDDMSANNEKLNVFSVDVPEYSTPPDGRQKGNNDRLSVNDARMLGAFFINQHLHYVLHGDRGNFFSSIIYGRIDVTKETAEQTEFGLANFDYTFPNIASMARTDDPTDKSAAIAFTRSGTSIFPETRVVLVKDDMTFASSTLVKDGTNFVNILSGKERWGDYSGISRRFANGTPEVWMAACFGENNDFRNNSYSTWVAQILASGSVPIPVANFSATPTSGAGPLVVQFTDLSTNNPTDWEWEFPGGNPSVSNVQNPKVTYNTKGSYDVSLVAINANGDNFTEKADFVTVTSSVGLAEFEKDENKIYPNPTNNLFNTAFRINEDGIASIALYSADGKLVIELLKDRLRPGLHEFSFSTQQLAAGNYFLKVSRGEAVIINESLVISR